MDIDEINKLISEIEPLDDDKSVTIQLAERAILALGGKIDPPIKNDSGTVLLYASLLIARNIAETKGGRDE